MRIAMLQSDPLTGARAQALLEDAGHEVLHCSDPAGQPFPCRGVTGDSCPLDAGAVVAVSAPATIPPEPQAGNVGLICAMRRHLPVLVAAPGDAVRSGSPLGLVAAGDLVASVESAASAVLPVHTKDVLDEARGMAGESATASVTRSAGGLQVDIGLPEGVEDSLAQAIAVRALGAVRRIDPWAATIDVRIGVL